MPTKKPNRTNEILDKIFKDAEMKYSLQEFQDIQIEKVLYIFEKDKGRYYLKCLKREKDIFVHDENKNKSQPEEIIRQLWIYKLNKIYKYPMDRIAVEYPVWFGSKVEKRATDIVVFYKNKDDAWIVGEVKKPDRKDGLKQLKAYFHAEGAPVGFWSNGQSHIFLFRPWPKEITALSDIPHEWEKPEDVMKKKTKIDELEVMFRSGESPLLKDILTDLEDIVLARRGVDVFEEAFKLIFAKLYDEWAAKNQRPDRSVEFRVKPGESHEDLHKRITELFHNAIEKWPGIFGRDEREIKIQGSALWTTISHLQNTLLFASELSVVDEAFEFLINKVYKGEKGQYFTPRHVIKMCVRMLDPKPAEKIVDPAAGSGGFLILAMFHVWEKLKEKVDQVRYASESLYGIDFDEKAQKVAKAIMLIAGDGSSNIFRLNSLEPWTWKGKAGFEAFGRMRARYEDEKKDEENKEEMKDFKFDIVMTNPPFAGDIDEREVLRFYDVARKNNKLVNKIGRHILFLERCLHFLKPGGRMAIVLPQGVLNTSSMKYIREYLFDKAQVLAVIGLHGNTFRPHAGVKTSVLFLKKWDGNEEIPKDYPIFMAVSKKGGKDNSGDYIYKKDASGNFVHDVRGRKVLDHDLDEVADEFIKFSKTEKLDF